MGSVGCASISEAVSSVSAELSVERSLSALKAVVEGEMKLEEDEGAPGCSNGWMERMQAIRECVCVCVCVYNISWLGLADQGPRPLIDPKSL